MPLGGRLVDRRRPQPDRDAGRAPEALRDVGATAQRPLDGTHVVDQVAAHIGTNPVQLRRSLTWDRGLELAEHVRFSVATGVAVYFCDPRSPWQRGSTRTPTGCRQYFPKRANIAGSTSDVIIRSLGRRNSPG
jgi:IS30 family transposase